MFASEAWTKSQPPSGLKKFNPPPLFQKNNNPTPNSHDSHPPHTSIKRPLPNAQVTLKLLSLFLPVSPHLAKITRTGWNAVKCYPKFPTGFYLQYLLPIYLSIY